MNNNNASEYFNNFLASVLKRLIRKGLLHCINVVSPEDPDIDFKVIVSKRKADKAWQALQLASDRYYDDEDPMYYYNGWGDTAKEELEKIGIKRYAIFYAPEKYESRMVSYNDIPSNESCWF